MPGRPASRRPGPPRRPAWALWPQGGLEGAEGGALGRLVLLGLGAGQVPQVQPAAGHRAGRLAHLPCTYNEKGRPLRGGLSR